MVGKIFINYRRGDQPGFTQALFARLEAAFEPHQLFMDIDNIEPGMDFVQALRDQVEQCDIVLAVIGRGWLDSQDERGRRRLDNENDFVRVEIESSIKLGKHIIPVLVHDAVMPRAEQLPDSIKPLARRQAIRLTHERFKADAQGLVKYLKKALPNVAAARQAAASAEIKERDSIRRKPEQITGNEVPSTQSATDRTNTVGPRTQPRSAAAHAGVENSVESLPVPQARSGIAKNENAHMGSGTVSQDNSGTENSVESLPVPQARSGIAKNANAHTDGETVSQENSKIENSVESLPVRQARSGIAKGAQEGANARNAAVFVGALVALGLLLLIIMSPY